MLPFVDKTILVRLRILCFSGTIEKNIWKERERWNEDKIRNILTISTARNASSPKGKTVRRKQ